MKEEYEEILNDLVGFSVAAKPDFDGNFEKSGIYAYARHVMLCRRLDRIADALELIEEHLSDLGDCITMTPRGSLLCITGNVTNYDV